MTDKLRAAAEMALKALKNKTTVYVRFDDGVVEATEILEDALMERLAEPDTEVDYWRKKAEHLEQENFAWRTKLGVRGYEIEIESLRQALEEPDSDANCDEPTAQHWLTKELFAEYLELIYHAITNMEDRSALLHKARWMKGKGKV